MMMQRQPFLRTTRQRKHCLYDWNHTVRCFQDDAFRWAQDNPDVARACLTVPEPTRTTPLHSIGSLDGFLDYRGYHVPNEHVRKLLSHTLSAPLTWASSVTRGTDKDSSSSSSSSSSIAMLPHRWCCVGARAEATLPPQWWNESLVLLQQQQHDNHLNDSIIEQETEHSWMTTNWSIDFVGPDVVPRKNPVRTSAIAPPTDKEKEQQQQQQESTLSLRWTYRGFLHDFLPSNNNNNNNNNNDSSSSNSDDTVVDTDKTRTVPLDGFILFNPGFGHPDHREGWKPTLERMVETGKPIRLTAHSEFDAERDLESWHQQFGHDTSLTLEYRPNAFASQIAYNDPFLDGHLVSPNMFVGMIR